MSGYLTDFEKDYSLINDESFLSTLYLFMRTLSIRTLNYRKGLENIATQTTDWLKSLNIKEVSNYPLDKEPSEIAKISQLSEIISLPRLFEKSTIFFENYDIFIGINNTGFNFLLSDNPMIYFMLGFNDICFPINPKLAIIMQHKKATKEFKVCDLKYDKDKICYLTELEVLKYNILQCNSNATYLFGKEKMIQAQLSFIEYVKSRKENNDMNNYIILHGSFGSKDGNWFPWLKEQLEKQNKMVDVPQMPVGVGNQNFENWSSELSKLQINENTTIIAHSIAPIFVCKYLITSKIKVKKLIFVCGFNNYLGIDKDFDLVNKPMFINNYEDVKRYCDNIVCYYSNNDPYVKFEVEKEFADNLTNNQIVIKNGGHINAESGYLSFDEILEVL